VSNRLSVQFGTIGIRSSQDYNQIISAIFIDCFLNTLLTLRVKRSSGGSDKTLSLD
jgi:hypothetical protein